MNVILACLADRWEDIAGHPVLELLGLRLVGAHHEFVEAGLGYDRCWLALTHSKLRSRQLEFLVDIKATQYARMEIKHLAYVSRDEPRVTVDLHHTDREDGRPSGWTTSTFDAVAGNLKSKSRSHLR